MLGFRIVGASSDPPDSITRTCAPEADNSAARTEPAAPAPTTMKSYCSFSTLVTFRSPRDRPSLFIVLRSLEEILLLTTVRIDPNHVAEIIKAARPGASPTAILDT